LEAALRCFARRGYSAATTVSIAEESGFSEFTLFWKFKTKENLFNMVLAWNIEKIRGELDPILTDREFAGPGEFLETFIRNLARLYHDNVEAMSIFQNEESSMLEPLMKE